MKTKFRKFSVQVALDKDERTSLIKAARKEGLTMSGYIRLLLKKQREDEK